ncbi:MAG: sugar ABC transporter ATP-binding protein [Clostridiaceae bacterium]
MVDIDKKFPGVHALKKCRFSLKKGEVHALVGENGAGKSTMMKILTGIYPEYGGDIFFNGKKVKFHSIKDAQTSGISIVHQELNMLNHLTVAQNIFIGRESNNFFTNEKVINEKTQKLINDFKINVKPTDKVADLSVGKAQMVEIARAMSYEATKILILDEPTAALSDVEALDLFDKVKTLKEKGVSIIFISHRMGEIKKITDRVTIMRDGEYVDTVETDKCEISEIICKMVGRDILHQPKVKSSVAKNAPVILEVKNLSSEMVKDVSFTLRKGEILGFAGLVGAGRTETMRLIFGADKRTSGEIYVNGQPVKIRHSVDAVKSGIGYLPEDRKQFGIVLGLSVKDNCVMARLDNYLKNKTFINDKACVKDTEKYIKDLKIKTPTHNQLVKNLSGGNQQKVVIAKWLIKDTEILIFDEPTRGIDIGAKEEIYNLMEKLASEGKSIIMVSSDLPEVLRLSDRIVVMCEGKKTKELDISEANQEVIMDYATRYSEEVSYG